MHRPDFVLVVAAMHNRMSAFNSGFIKAKSKFDGAEAASNVSQLSMKEVEEAAKRKDSNLRVSGPANQLLNSTSASCRPVGHSNEAADKDLAKLDKNLRLLRDRPDVPYGGMSIVFAGDFHQSKTMSGSPIYDAWLIQWHGSINCSTMLEGSHRFADDPEWGETLKRAQNGTDTVEDREKINERWLHLEGIALPTEGDICYACPFNRGRNAINATIFRNHIEATHPKVSDQMLNEMSVMKWYGTCASI